MSRRLQTRARRKAQFVFACGESRRRRRSRRKREHFSTHSSRRARRAPPCVPFFCAATCAGKTRGMLSNVRFLSRETLAVSSFYLLSLSRASGRERERKRERGARATRSNSRKRESRARDARETTSSAQSEGLFSLDGLERSRALAAVTPAFSSARSRLSLSGRTHDSIQLSRESRERRRARAVPGFFFVGAGSSDRAPCAQSKRAVRFACLRCDRRVASVGCAPEGWHGNRACGPRMGPRRWRTVL